MSKKKNAPESPTPENTEHAPPTDDEVAAALARPEPVNGTGKTRTRRTGKQMLADLRQELSDNVKEAQAEFERAGVALDEAKKAEAAFVEDMRAALAL